MGADDGSDAPVAIDAARADKTCSQILPRVSRRGGTCTRAELYLLWDWGLRYGRPRAAEPAMRGVQGWPVTSDMHHGQPEPFLDSLRGCSYQLCPSAYFELQSHHDKRLRA